jgi:hypothetical protein
MAISLKPLLLESWHTQFKGNLHRLFSTFLLQFVRHPCPLCLITSLNNFLTIHAPIFTYLLVNPTFQAPRVITIETNLRNFRDEKTIALGCNLCFAIIHHLMGNNNNGFWHTNLLDLIAT